MGKQSIPAALHQTASGVKAIILWELRSRRWSIVWWVVGIGLFVTINIMTYPSFRDQADQLNASLNQMPEAVRQMFSDTGDFMSPIGFLSSQIFYLMLPLLFSILSIGLGGSLIAREEQRRTIELLLSRPLSRGMLLLGKFCAGLVVSSAVAVVVALICLVEVALVGFSGVSAVSVVLATLMSFLLSLIFGTVAFMFTAFGGFGRSVSIAIASLLALGGYVISSLDKVVTWLEVPARVFPYHYYRPAYILEGSFTLLTAVVFVAVTIVFVLISWLLFRRRDIE